MTEADAAAPYPAPPWRTFGDAVFRAYLVPAERVRPPDGFEVEARFGCTLGLLGFVDYRSPSPLTYRELLWMPARVRGRRADGRRARGFFVAKMYVDDRASLAAGRALWALPKQMASFDVGPHRVTVRGEDGPRVEIERGRALLGVRASSSVVTLQRDDDGLVRFRGDFFGRVAPCRVRFTARGLDASWHGLDASRPLGPLGVSLGDFEATMRPPERPLEAS